MNRTNHLNVEIFVRLKDGLATEYSLWRKSDFLGAVRLFVVASKEAREVVLRAAGPDAGEAVRLMGELFEEDTPTWAEAGPGFEAQAQKRRRQKLQSVGLDPNGSYTLREMFAAARDKALKDMHEGKREERGSA